MNAPHTPTPWVQKGRRVEVHGRGTIVECPLPTSGGVFEATENAAFIVRACNAHEELVAALRWIVANDGQCLGDHPDRLLQARAALSKAGAP